MKVVPPQKPGRSEQTVETPDDFLSAVKHRLNIRAFTVDLAASESNAKATLYYTEEQNSLTKDWNAWAWDGWCWLNPPLF